jgi:hypothetical protein
MSGADDVLSAVQKIVGDKPLFLLAGASDLVNEKLRELPEALNSWQEEHRDVPMKAAGALVGRVFRANLKVGELYDELTRRGEEVMSKMRGEPVYAEEDEPFVREPFMPEPVHRPETAPVVQPPKTVVKQAPAKQAPAKKAGASKVPAKKAPAKKAPAKNAGATTAEATNAAKKAATKAQAPSKVTTRKVATKKPAPGA